MAGPATCGLETKSGVRKTLQVIGLQIVTSVFVTSYTLNLCHSISHRFTK
jgi:hypothetical protein